MKVALGADHAGKRQHVDARRAVPPQHAGAFLDRGARGQHVVDQQHPLARQDGFPAGPERKGAPDVAPTAQPRQPALLRGVTPAHQQIDCEPGRRRPGDRGGQQGGLVVAPREQAPAVQRHRGDQLRLRDEVRARAPEPAAVGRRGMRLVGVLEAEEQRSARIVVAEHRARPVERRPHPRTGDAQGPGRRLVGKGKAATAAARRGEKSEAPPAGGTQRADVFDDDAAGQAARRQHCIERRMQRRGADPCQ